MQEKEAVGGKGRRVIKKAESTRSRIVWIFCHGEAFGPVVVAGVFFPCLGGTLSGMVSLSNEQQVAVCRVIYAGFR